jgi:hypothetical protein
MKALGLTVSTALVLALASGSARAYPQFQLSRGETCTGCHVSPAGGGLLTENGLAVSEAISRWGAAPEFFYGKVPTPDWLVLGGDLRGAAGYMSTPEDVTAAFPMQIEAYGHATFGSGFSLYADLGLRPTQVGSASTTFAWSREHYLMWQDQPGEAGGLYVRVGRFMPVFGMRLAEHPVYTRKWGGTPLFAETYGLAVEYVTTSFEAHATGFLEDPLIDTPEHSSGAAALAEYRLGEHASLGGEFMYTSSADDEKYRVGVLGKLYLPGPETLLQLEAQFMNQLIEPRGAPKQVIAYLMASRSFAPAYMLDVGLGFFDENIQITELHREALDVNFHWFLTSHFEAILTSRFETLAFGAGGPNAGYALIQAHYRL